MPIRSREDAAEVESCIARIFAAPPSDRATEIRTLFVETLDFSAASGQVSLHPAPKHVALPAAAERIAESDGVHVLYIALDTPDTDRVRKTEAATAAELTAAQLGEDLLLLFTNPSASQLHLVHPNLEDARRTLRRMIVERDLPRRTAVQQVSNIYWYRQDTGSIRTALERAFDVEAVTKHFFDEYKRVFDHAMERVEGFGADENEQERKKLFVQTLFNRLMFVYFVSRKGWLTFGNDNDYLSALWNDYFSNPDQSNFYSDRLYHLFFFGLNNPQSRDLNFKDRFMASIFGEVPFLNGGLFDRKPEDDLTGLFVPDDCISQVFEELFKKFNFTVMESTPFDIEVAVDPEMLGKVFEELVTGRHDTGSYYTPRPVVSFMCREALKGYLEGRETGLDPEAIAGFVDERKTSSISQTAAPRIAEALENVTVVDPACGSGAYLLGMMQELVDLRTTLFNVGIDPKSLYELKLHIIQRNLYGADIDEFAANIAMLRMWLSLAVEYEGDTPEPLPNLDFKIVLGDSLLGPDPSPGNYVDLFRHRAHEVAARLAELKAELHERVHHGARNALKGRYRKCPGRAQRSPRRHPRTRGRRRLARPVRRGLRPWRIRHRHRQPALHPATEGRRQTGQALQEREVHYIRQDRRRLPALLRAGLPASSFVPRPASLHHVQQLAEGRVRQAAAPLLLHTAHASSPAGARQGCVRERHRGQQRAAFAGGKRQRPFPRRGHGQAPELRLPSSREPVGQRPPRLAMRRGVYCPARKMGVMD